MQRNLFCMDSCAGGGSGKTSEFSREGRQCFNGLAILCLCLTLQSALPTCNMHEHMGSEP